MLLYKYSLSYLRNREKYYIYDLIYCIMNNKNNNIL